MNDAQAEEYFNIPLQSPFTYNWVIGIASYGHLIVGVMDDATKTTLKEPNGLI